MLSLPQASYLQTSFQAYNHIRPDARSLTEFRPISFGVSVLSGCLGSVHLSWGPISMLVGIKGEVSIGRASIEHHVEISGERDDDFETTTVSEVLDILLALDADHGIDPADLFVTSGYSWSLYVDLTVLTSDGSNLLPAVSLALRLALSDARLPRTIPSKSEDGMKSNDFDVDDDFMNARPIESATRLPLFVIANFVGPHVLFDASPEEEQVLTARYLIGIHKQGKLSICKNLNTVDPQNDTQGKSDLRGLASEDLRTGLRKGFEVCTNLFKSLDAHHNTPQVVQLFDIL